jgi:hypothetical protein
MRTMIAAWGYLGAEDDPIERWGADAIAQQPDDVLKVFGLA